MNRRAVGIWMRRLRRAGDELRAELERDRALLENEREMRASLLSEASDNKPEGQ